MIQLLLVEDEKAHAELIRRAFDDQAEPVEVTVINSLQEAYLYLARFTPDLIIIDLFLPDGQGIELLSDGPAEQLYPVVAITSHGDERMAVEAIKAGALDYVVKSEEAFAAMPRIIRRALREWGHIVDRRRAEAEIRRRNRELALLNRVIAASATSLEPKEILETACRELAIAFELSLAIATSLNDEKTAATVVAKYSAKKQAPELGVVIPVVGTPSLQHFLTNKTPLVSNHAQTDSRRDSMHEQLRKQGIVSLLSLPLILGREIAGSLDLIALEPHHFSAEEVSLAWSVADQIAGALVRTRLHKAHRLLSTAIEQTAESVIITDTAGVVLYVNPAFEYITGYDRNEIVEKTPRLLKSGRQNNSFYQNLWQTITAGQVWRGQFINKKKNGELYTAEATITPVRDESGEIINYISAQRDVTHELKLEEQLRQSQKMEAVGQLAGGIAHDFNNILQAILGYTYIAKSALPSESPVQPDLDQVVNSANRATSLIQQLLAFSRQETLLPQYLDLNEVIENLLKMLQRLIGEHLSLELHTQDDLNTVYADLSQIEQILLNLCVNARDAMPTGGKITIRTENLYLDGTEAGSYPWPHAGNYVLLSVSDTGVGISPEIQERIFEPFFTTKEVGQGTGLGLATVYAITKQHDGLINVQSEPGQGTTFEIYLPAIEKEKSLPIKEKISAPLATGGTETILLAEDDDFVRRFTVQVLETAGYQVLVAQDGEEAIRLFKQQINAVDLVLLDAVMPKKGGQEVYDLIKDHRPQIPVLFSTGYSYTILNNHLPQEGAQVLRKPYGPTDLLHKVREILEPESYRP